MAPCGTMHNRLTWNFACLNMPHWVAWPDLNFCLFVQRHWLRAMVLACFGQGRHVPLWCRQGQKLQITTTLGVVSRALLIRPCIWMACCRGWWVVHQRAPSCSKLSSCQKSPKHDPTPLSKLLRNLLGKLLYASISRCGMLGVKTDEEIPWTTPCFHRLQLTLSAIGRSWRRCGRTAMCFEVVCFAFWSQSVSFGRWEALCFAIGRLLVVRQLFPRILRWKGRDLKLHRASQAAFVQRYGDRTCSASPARVKSCIPQSIWGKSWGEVTRRPKLMRIWHN